MPFTYLFSFIAAMTFLSTKSYSELGPFSDFSTHSEGARHSEAPEAKEESKIAKLSARLKELEGKLSACEGKIKSADKWFCQADCVAVDPTDGDRFLGAYKQTGTNGGKVFRELLDYCRKLAKGRNPNAGSKLYVNGVPATVESSCYKE